MSSDSPFLMRMLRKACDTLAVTANRAFGKSHAIRRRLAGGRGAPRGSPESAERLGLAASTAPVLGHFAESDPYEAEQGLAAFEEALRSAGRSATINRYVGTGHWFAEPSRDAYRREAAESAFPRTVEFLRA
jgi:dienelactone hydrolase